MLAVLLVAGLGAPAEPADLEFSWDAPPECPTEADVRFRVGALLEGVRVPPKERLTAIARVRQDDTAMWDLRIWLVGQDSTRQRILRNRDCEALAQATALILAIAIAPELMPTLDAPPLEGAGAEESRTDESGPEASARAAPKPAPPTPKPRTSGEGPRPASAPDRARRKLGGTLAVEAGAGVGALPRVGAELAAAAGVRLGRATLELRGVYGAPRRVRFEDLPASGANFQMWTVGVRGGVALEVRPRLEARVRGAVDAGQILAVGINLAPSRRAVVPYVAVSVSAGLSYAPLRWLAIGLILEGYAPVTRPRFAAIGASNALHRPWPVGVRVLAGPELRFP